jgi:hypothetical protein
MVAASSPASRWKILYEEDFKDPLPAADGWKADKPNDERADPFGDDGEFFRINGGKDFERQRASFNIYRRRIRFGRGGWLTAELAARATKIAAGPADPPSLTTGTVSGLSIGLIRSPAHDGGLIIRSTRPLPAVYRVEYELVSLDFGGSRDQDNGYAPTGAKTAHPWTWGPDKILAQPYDQWPDVRDVNGFYYLAIVDYPDPEPHNNVFIHNHRKVVMDSYNTPQPTWQVCDPAKKEYYVGNDNVLNMFFLIPGTSLESNAVMQTECGTVRGGEDGHSAFVGAAQLLPGETYRFAIERSTSGYTLEASGVFRSTGKAILRYHRDFKQEGLLIWHYNQTSWQYDGSADKSWAYRGPYGEFSVVHSWPKESAYPDYFIIGDPHLNYYEGTASITALRLYVPQ